MSATATPMQTQAPAQFQSGRSNPSQEEIQSFKMPPVAVGSPVKWWKAGRQGVGRAEVGFVIGSFARTLRVRLISGMVKETVRHVSDPKLRLNADQREGGAWDYTDETLAVQAELKSLHGRIDKLERLLDGSDNIRVDSPAADDYETISWPELRSIVSDRGIEAKGNPKKEELIALLREHDAAQSSSQPEPNSGANRLL